MATLHHHNTSPHAAARPRVSRRHSLDCPSSLASLLRQHHHHLHPTNTITISMSSSSSSVRVVTSSVSATAAAATTTPDTAPDTAFSLEALQRHLASGDFRQADDETRRLLIVLAGEAAIKRGYVFFSEVQFIPKQDLNAIDELWLKYSNGRFGYSVQKKIWSKVDKDFTKFFIKVGWMKKLDTEIEQYNYRAFPNEFIWELNDVGNGSDDEGGQTSSSKKEGGDVPPEGHLPLTNALRGTQLLKCILSHPAFADGDGDEADMVADDGQGGGVDGSDNKKKSRFASLRDKFFKPNYTF